MEWELSVLSHQFFLLRLKLLYKNSLLIKNKIKNQASKLWKGMEEPYMYAAKWKKLIWKGYTPYDSNYMTF